MAVDVRFESWFHHRWLCFYSIQRARAMRSFATACCDVELVVRLLLHRIHALLLHIQLVVDVLVIRVAISIQKCECNAQNNGDVIQWLVCGVIPLLHHKKHVFDIKTESLRGNDDTVWFVLVIHMCCGNGDGFVVLILLNAILFWRIGCI
eukprot:260253_1